MLKPSRHSDSLLQASVLIMSSEEGIEETVLKNLHGGGRIDDSWEWSSSQGVDHQVSAGQLKSDMVDF